MSLKYLTPEALCFFCLFLQPLQCAENIKSPNEKSISLSDAMSNEAIVLNSGSYYLRPVKNGIENSAVFHNHIDASTHILLRDIVGEIEKKSPDFQNKIYPISNLILGPQLKNPAFSSVYNCLPNFHTINGMGDEAFSTGKMGDDNFNYEQILVTLNTTSSYTNHGVMTELEEDIYQKEFKLDGSSSITLNRGCTPYVIDWSKLPGWKDKQIADIPRFELHHSIDITKSPGETIPPIDLDVLMQLSIENGFDVGGWFIFRKNNFYAFRSNEFSNANYEECLERLNAQAEILREIVKKLVPGREFTSSCSLEKVHAIWRF